MENPFIQTLFLSLSIRLGIACGNTEYQRGKDCCHLCPPGHMVQKHCESCTPCTGSTFLDQPNGLTSCFPCRECDAGLGLKVKQSCTPTSDAVCELLEGHFCTQLTKHGCESLHKHTRCKPGQYISQQGTSSTDTNCSDCTGDTFCNGSMTSCQPHTKCALGKVQHYPGTHSSDTTCQSAKVVHIVAISIVLVVFSLTLGGFVVRKIIRQC